MAYSETGDVEAWLLAQLRPGGRVDAGLAALGVGGVYGYRIPQGNTRSAVVISQVVSEDENSADGTRGATRCTYLVKAVTQGEDSAPAEAIMRRVDGLIQRQAGQMDGRPMGGCVRENAVKYPEVFEGRCWWHVGGQYYIWAMAV